MQPILTTESRPEAMADVPGICELPLTRAVVQYRDVHELYRVGGRIQDIGLAVVVEGRFASAVRALDLGSAKVKHLNLASELVILDWVYDPTLAHIRTLAEPELDAAGTVGPGPPGELRRYCFDLALRVLDRRGFSHITRPTLLRIGFRDLCKDLDLHESTAVRIVTGRGEVTRVHLDYDANALVFRSTVSSPRKKMESAIRRAFPNLRVQRSSSNDPVGFPAWQVRFGVPVSFAELRAGLMAMRRGLGHLFAYFEPERFRSLEGLLATFGERATLERFAHHGTREEWRETGHEVSSAGRGQAGAGVVHATPMSVH